jgi:dsRNA-specific ribonuclease
MMGVLSPEGEVIAMAMAKNKKEAEQMASRHALDILKKAHAKKAGLGNVTTK